jgi:hypothetical protein
MSGRRLRRIIGYSLSIMAGATCTQMAFTPIAICFQFAPSEMARHGTEPVPPADILDIAMAGTSATLLARKWESAMLVNVDNDTLRRILDNPEAMS